jgi:hypothetical protein
MALATASAFCAGSPRPPAALVSCRAEARDFGARDLSPPGRSLAA